MKKTTIELPEDLYKRAKIRAVQQGRTFKALVVEALKAELAEDDLAGAERLGYWANRRYLPDFDRFRRQGAYVGGTDSTEGLSEDRDRT